MPNPTTQIDLSFLRNRAVQKRIAVVTLACATAGLLYGLLAPKWYRSVLTVVPARSQQPAVSRLLGAEALASVAGLDGASFGGVGRIAAVLESVAVSDAVIEKFDLRKRYDAKYQETARDELWRHCDVKTLMRPGLVQLSCEDRDPKFAQQMLAYFADYGNQVFRRVSVSSASEEVRFLEKRVGELRQQADDAAARMREFQEKHHIIDLDTQAKAVVSSLAALNSQSITKQMELDYARTFSAGDEPTMRQLRSQLSVVEGKARDLQEPSPDGGQPAEKGKGRRIKGSSADMFPAALAVPQLRADFEKLYRDSKVAEATLVFALERLEGARANEARDVSTFLVLDPPTVPTKKSRPKRTLAVIATMTIGFLAALFFEFWRSHGAASLLAATATDLSRGGFGAS